MYDTLAILLCDTYKTCHNRMFPNKLTKLVSYWISKKIYVEISRSYGILWTSSIY